MDFSSWLGSTLMICRSKSNAALSVSGFIFLSESHCGTMWRPALGLALKRSPGTVSLHHVAVSGPASCPLYLHDMSKAPSCDLAGQFDLGHRRGPGRV
jgi:hypothetical protein